MSDTPRFISNSKQNAYQGIVTWSPVKSLWITAMAVFGVGGACLTLSLDNVLVFLFTTALTICLGHSLGMHRLLIHRSYQTHAWIEYLFVWLGVLVGLAGPHGMMRTHDLRDWAQRQHACHDFFAHRQKWQRDCWWQMHCDIQLANPPEYQGDARIDTDPVYRFIERYWMWQQLPVAIGLYVFGGWEWVIWGVPLRVTVSILGHWLIGYLAHNGGHRRWHVSGAAVQGYNVRFCGILTMGECWHNNHHAFPGSAQIGTDVGQVDPGWWVLKGMRYFGLVWGVVLPENLPTVPTAIVADSL